MRTAQSAQWVRPASSPTPEPWRKRTRARDDPEPLLIAAARAGNSGWLDVLIAIKVLVNAGVNHQDADGLSALMFAARDGHHLCVATLLAAHGVSVNQRNKRGSTALTLAADNGHVLCVRALLAAPGIDANHATPRSGHTALTLAARCGHAACVSALVASRAVDPNLADNEGNTALALAAQVGSARCVWELLRHPGVDMRSAIAAAAKHGHAECLRQLLDAAPAAADCANAADERGETALMLAADNGHTACVRMLAARDGVGAGEAGGDGGRGRGRNALMLACKRGHVECIRALLAASAVAVAVAVAQADASNKTALTMAAKHGHADAVRLLLATGAAAVNATVSAGHDTGHTALTLAAKHGHTACVRALAPVAGPTINQRTHGHGETALEYCTARGDVAAAGALVAAGTADLRQRSRSRLAEAHLEGGAVLHLACRNRHAELAAIFLTAGACRFQGDAEHRLPLEHASGCARMAGVFASGVDYWQRKLHNGSVWTSPCARALVCGGRAEPHLPNQLVLGPALGPACTRRSPRAQGGNEGERESGEVAKFTRCGYCAPTCCLARSSPKARKSALYPTRSAKGLQMSSPKPAASSSDAPTCRW